MAYILKGLSLKLRMKGCDSVTPSEMWFFTTESFCLKLQWQQKCLLVAKNPRIIHCPPKV